MVDSVHLSVLISSYHKHFAKFSEKRKKACKQLVPKAVWIEMYQYKTAYPNSEFSQDTLKNRVRETLEAVATGRSDCKLEGGLSIHPDAFLEKIKESDGHVSRNILGLRKSILEKSVPTPEKRSEGVWFLKGYKIVS